jgi:hypothetical protein
MEVFSGVFVVSASIVMVILHIYLLNKKRGAEAPLLVAGLRHASNLG